MSKFTRGPWSCFLFHDDTFLILNAKNPYEVICNLLTKSDEYPELKDAIDKETQEANARLIQHAPEMYLKLKMCRGYLAVHNPVMANAIDNLLSRIDGESETNS